MRKRWKASEQELTEVRRENARASGSYIPNRKASIALFSMRAHIQWHCGQFGVSTAKKRTKRMKENHTTQAVAAKATIISEER